jgi:aryl-alcohol dehydrogenase-like predicted oxidoreductase
MDAERHEVKRHDLGTYERQLAGTRVLLGDRLRLYQVHSVTPDSPLLTDRALLDRLGELRDSGVEVGVSVSGPNQGEAIERALELTAAGRPLVSSVQATWNLVETSAGPALAAAHAAGVRVVVKEAVANGRLTDPRPAGAAGAGVVRGGAAGGAAAAGGGGRVGLGGAGPPAGGGGVELIAAADRRGVGVDAVAIGVVRAQPWAGVVLSGAVTPAQLSSNATPVTFEPGELEALTAAPEDPVAYWAARSARPWR